MDNFILVQIHSVYLFISKTQKLDKFLVLEKKETQTTTEVALLERSGVPK